MTGQDNDERWTDRRLEHLGLTIKGGVGIDER